MKVEVNSTEKKEEIKFPCLMKSELGTIVIMYGRGKGTCLIPERNGSVKVGQYYENWIHSNFTPFKGTITLSND